MKAHDAHMDAAQRQSDPDSYKQQLTRAPASSTMAQLAALQGAIDRSPRIVAQRLTMDAVFGRPNARQANEPEDEPLQARAASSVSEPASTATPGNATGMPDQLKAGIESLSGMNLSDVRVHFNSQKPAQLSALAYAQGNDIHLGPGQDQHLPHEAWHVVQQRQGRVRETMQMAGVGINDNAELEREADSMGARAAVQRIEAPGNRVPADAVTQRMPRVLQRYSHSQLTAPNGPGQSSSVDFLFQKRRDEGTATTGAHNYAVVLLDWVHARSSSNSHAELKLLTLVKRDPGQEMVIVSEYKPCPGCQRDLQNYESTHGITIRVLYLLNFEETGDGDKEAIRKYYVRAGLLTGGGLYTYQVV